jgi:uncharacterized protein
VTLQVQRFAAHRRMPWRNGGGVTYEVVRSPVDSDSPEFDWRISIAEVAASGPFSAFPGVDRLIMLVDGGEMTLTVDGPRHPLWPLEPFAFDGGSDTSCEVAAPTRDLNVMTRRGHAAATVEVLRMERPDSVLVHPADPLVLVGLAGAVVVSSADGERVEVGVLDACWSGSPLTVTGSGAVAAIRIRNPRGPTAPRY